METVGAEIFELLKEAITGIFAVVSKITLFLIWALLALIILPCVFVAGHIFPLWQEWGEEF